MKRFLSFLFSALILVSVLACPAYAAQNEAPEVSTETFTEYFDDGSYLVTTVSSSEITTMSVAIKSGSKSSHYYSSKNEELWVVTVHGTFSYNGASATCTESSVSYKVYDDFDWKVTSAIASKSGANAIGNFTVKHYFTFVPVKTIERTVTLNCSKSGVLS
ncbi:MAG: hypothetical protein J1F23_05265 [Oscillospiraceae bacterium]|nr:hypothetical protein [Oscillospiraceae bacterium]